MLALRLPPNIESKLEEISKSEKKTKSELLREAIELYFIEYYKKNSVFESGKNFFGKYGSGTKDNSQNYKKKLKGKINAKRTP
jgi:RHH-type rel operon transcriptional repressor/antitoxin RelB